MVYVRKGTVMVHPAQVRFGSHRMQPVLASCTGREGCLGQGDRTSMRDW
jgi:hypothetical protein